MRRRRLLLVAAIALIVALILAGLAATASAAEVVKSGVDFEAHGKVVAKSTDRLVVRTDDHGHRIAFAIDRNTVMPEDLAVGRHADVVGDGRGGDPGQVRFRLKSGASGGCAGGKEDRQGETEDKEV